MLRGSRRCNRQRVVAAIFYCWLQPLGSDELVAYSDGSDNMGNTIGTGSLGVTMESKMARQERVFVKASCRSV